jgi:hypothetical protein
MCDVLAGMGSVDNPRLLTNLPAQVSSFVGRDGELE